MNSVERASAECNILAKIISLLDNGAAIKATDPGDAIIHEEGDHLVLTNLTIECTLQEENNNGS